MRGAVVGDTEQLVEYSAEMHREPGREDPAVWIGEWVRDLMTKPHPTTSLDDIIVVEDTATGKIVSSTVYFTQTWTYSSVEFPSGQPELVSTHPDYRNRGLIRQQFAKMHEWGEQRGHLAQCIEGIPYYYRQFGYEMALEMPLERTAAAESVAGWKEGEQRTVSLRPATPDDLDFIKQLYDSSQSRSLVSASVGHEDIRYLLFARSSGNAVSVQPLIAEDVQGERLGYAVTKTVLPIEQAWVYAAEFADSALWSRHGASFLKALKSSLEEQTNEQGKRVKKLAMALPAGHPLLTHLGWEFAPIRRRPYAAYVRVPDLVAFLRKIKPVLEQRLIGTAHEGYTGDLLISFYRTGVRLRFSGGELAGADRVKFPERQQASVHFPDLTFLQMVFGRRSFAELHDAFVDCNVKSGTEADLMDTLFPKRSSNMVFAPN